MPIRGMRRASLKAGVILVALQWPVSATSAAEQDGQQRSASCVSGQICTSSGPDVAYLTPIVQQYVGPYLTANGITGAVVGVSWQGRRTYFGYGYYNDANNLPYSPNTIVEIGSITKVFTTALFEEAVADNKVQLKGELNTYASMLGLGSLNWCAGLRNLQQLADFSSGLPRLPPFDTSSPPDIRAYSVSDFLTWVSHWTPKVASDHDPAKCRANADYDYSNASVGLLGIILSETYQQGWYTLVNRRINLPLGMKSTFVGVPRDQNYRLARGYTEKGGPAQAWPVYAWYAAGVLRSDTADMLSFGEAALGNKVVNGISARTPAIGALETAISQAIVPVYTPTVNGNTFGQGLAWEELIPTATQDPIYVKNGGTNGFSTALAVNKVKDLAVFIAFPKQDSSAQPIGVDLVRSIASQNAGRPSE